MYVMFLLICRNLQSVLLFQCKVKALFILKA